MEIQRLTIRGGKLLAGKSDLFTEQLSPDADVLESYINQYYAEGQELPEEVLLPFALEGREGLADLLSERRGKRVNVLVPERGEKRALVAMANKNAELSFQARKDRERSQQTTLEQLQERLHLRNFPRRIECFDMSNIQGTNPVGSMVAFTDGEPDKARYRKFQVKTVEGPDDFASMYEVLSRRYTRALEEDDLPDLIMVDGGKGQLNIAQAVLWELGIETPDLISIAKSRLKPVQGAEEKHRTDERFSYRVARTRSFCRPIPRDFSCCSGFAMKRIALPSPITKAAAPRRPCIRPSTTSPALGPSADRPSCGISAASTPLPPPAQRPSKTWPW